MRWEMKSQGVCPDLWLQVTHLSPVLTRGRSRSGPPLLCLLLPSKQHGGGSGRSSQPHSRMKA